MTLSLKMLNGRPQEGLAIIVGAQRYLDMVVWFLGIFS